MPFPLPTSGQVLNLTIPGDRYAVRSAARSIRAFLELHETAVADLDAWELIAVEAGNNAVKHAQADAPPQPVEFAVEVDSSRIELRIADRTAGFNLPETVELPDPLVEHGRGLFLMRTFSDHLEYFRGSESNLLVIRKQRKGGVPASPTSAVFPGGSAHGMGMPAPNEELAAAYHSLSLIFRLGTEFQNATVTPSAVQRWLGELVDLIGADFSLLRLARPGEGHLEAYCGWSVNGAVLAPLPLDPPETPWCAELRAAFGRADVTFSAQHPLDPDDPLRSLGSHLEGNIHPICVHTDLVGVLTVGNRGREKPFSPIQTNLFQTFADFLGISFRNVWAQDQQMRALLVTHELDIASGIQRSLLPTHLPEPMGYRFAGHSKSANEVGGDFYDVIELPGNGILLAIADVMGKGVPAAMFAAILRSQIRARPELAAQPGDFLQWLNIALFRDLDRVDMFVTAQLAFLDFSRAELCVASAGHCPLLLSSRESVHQLHPDGLPLGITPDSVYPEQRVSLEPGTRALLYTDGLVELRNLGNQPLGLPAIESWLQDTARSNLSAPETRASLLELTRKFQHQTNARDDLTFLVLAPHLESSASASPSSGSRP